MSGIAGLFYRNNRPVHLEQLQKIGKALAHRGPDGISYFCHNSIGLSHCMLHDTSESLLETLPHKTDDGRLVITFHGRIDNREDLSVQTGLRKPLSETTDSDLVLAAYDTWGNGCAEHLLGDFAFAIWNETAQNLFCARDHMGVKPFYYFLDGARFVFASEIRGLLALSEIPKILNEERVADYLTSVVIDKESTFYKNIFRLPPGHFLEIHRERTQLARYHEFSPIKLQCNKNAEYEEQFREIFADAVRVRLRSVYPVGSYLSGGLDSASIVCTAVGLFENEILGKLQTFSGIFNTLLKCDERKYFLPVVERYRTTSHTLSVDKINPSIAFEKLINDEDEPFLSQHIFMGMGLLSLAKKSGVRVLLDGHDGDAAVSYGYSLLAELAMSGKLNQLKHCYKQMGVTSLYSIMRRLILLYWNVLCKKVPVSSPLSPVRRDIVNSLKILNPDFARRIGILNRLVLEAQELPLWGQKEELYHLKNITQPVQPYALEIYDRISTRQGVIARYPYFDKRVIEFCLALPVRQKFKEGLNRSIVRRALADLLPEGIKGRRNKTNFTPSLLHAFRENDQEWLLKNIDCIAASNFKYINKAYCISSVAKYKNINTRLMQLILRDLLLLVFFSRWRRKVFG